LKVDWEGGDVGNTSRGQRLLGKPSQAVAEIAVESSLIIEGT
jgi:hypothetical protein